MVRNLPIGVFDSGIGGLTVLKSLQEKLPNENFIYLGDVARLPYGTKSQSVVEKYVRSCVNFLSDRQVKWIVVACNTATAMALKVLEHEMNVGMTGVIEPGVRAALKASPSKRIVVLATQSTVASAAYLAEFRRQDPDAQVTQVACPLLVPLAEEGWFDRETTQVVVRHYLDQVKEIDYDTVLMGCTHYPLLENAIRNVAGGEIRLVHSGVTLADELATTLQERELITGANSLGRVTCFATDEVARARPIALALFGRQMEFEKVDLS